ncbi:hypothetical protein E4T39_04644 [Aureobasidium subglaciale]|nr:hypothetical protein E4T39_04644 [Aureobasidium subglaciale]
MSSPQQPTPTLGQKLASNPLTLPIILLWLLGIFDYYIYGSYDLAFPMRVWVWSVNLGVGMVVVEVRGGGGKVE